LGATRYNVATPAYSNRGIGGQWRQYSSGLGFSIDLRYAQNVARDHVLASDPQGSRPETFYKIEEGLLYFVAKILAMTGMIAIRRIKSFTEQTVATSL